MRKTVQVISYETRTLCDGCIAKNATETEASEALTLGERSWDLCPVHAERFGSYLADALGGSAAVSEVTEVHDVEPVATANIVVAEHADVEHQDHEEQGNHVDVRHGQPVVGADVGNAVSQHDVPAGQHVNADVGVYVEPEPSVMVSGVVEGYDHDSVRDAVRNLGYRVVGRADETTVLLIAGHGAEKATAKLRDAMERKLACLDATVPGRFRDAVCRGELTGGDPIPEPVRKDAQAMREWARANGYNVSERGRISMQVKHAYKLAQQAGVVAA
uniref:Lsr2 family protein n=1 Tax=Streptomyces sp. NBC_00003 TaxID=2903608 RepID=A0AAU2VAL0_9ACTN